MPKTGVRRRQFLSGLLATGLLPKSTWADAGAPVFLAAAARPDGRFLLCGIGADLAIRLELPLPARGHDAATHPTRPVGPRGGLRGGRRSKLAWDNHLIPVCPT
ncbi:hypothetical protein [uncultured Litoreibacter sp.]|uniref:hypothetical protein n=1 Tax=uncultured Litoreibacter sp. TaxID=1392394 RepID=UPI003436DC1F